MRITEGEEIKIAGRVLRVCGPVLSVLCCR